MNDQTDQQLLRDYLAHRSETAFAELVRRHVDLVYSAAWRLVGDAHRAQDVTQATFVALAQNAKPLADRAILSGWLHTTARHLAVKTIRTDARRRQREQEAATMNESHADSGTGVPPVWSEIAPHLDALLGELTEAERDAVLLRYFEKKTAAEMAVCLGISAEASQKRVNRAVEKLRALFTKRGVTVGAGGLAAVISVHAVQAAPVGLALTISSVALAGTAATTSTLIAATKTIAMTTLQKTLVTATVAVLAGAGIYEARQVSQLRNQVQTLRQQQAPLAEQIQQLQGELNKATDQLLARDHALAAANKQDAELLRLRNLAARLLNNQQLAGTTTTANEWIERVQILRTKLNQTPEVQIPELVFLTDEDWLDAAKAELKSDFDFRRAFASLRNAAESRLADLLIKALGQYALEHDSHEPKRLDPETAVFPREMLDLHPYLDPSKVTDEMLSRFEIITTSSLEEDPKQRGEFIITQKAAVDAELDQRWAIGLKTSGTIGNFEQLEIANCVKQLASCVQAFADEHGGAKPRKFEELQPYLTSNEEKAAISKLEQKFPSAHLVW